MRRILSALCLSLLAAGPGFAASCGNTSSGFNAWKSEFAAEAKAAGVKDRGIGALMNASYSTRTINADRNQKGVKYSFDKFVQIRLGSLSSFAATGKKRLARNAAFYGSLEQRYGVPAGILISIHGMETGFGRNMGSEPVINSILTVAYDCRRPGLFRPHAIAALQMVDRGMLSPNQKGAYHGELGHTQFLPGNAMRFGVDGNGDGRVDFYNEADALASTANYLRQKGWKKGQPYRQGTANFRVLNEWNAATVYQQAIAAAAERIDN
ncbi:lytic transglycosylase domain-containing protein [Tropicibacter naphthalenivorans]|uniref:Membrane-bound lytic murein transglycosylase B n=1 Tax=Tropicibacter naphthalenivorans TaxID=441103 RepID=A0A0P1GEW6_9RHOB|nr:lytic murein transglycosylase [Tropicibacter naphthalenivorans]CUH80056.1 Membrane-bound lytic murein transglycosylase B precursor [Tropicibacter naphthalenivorans]SMC84144.1 Membrane-bound lytic murein transglycosylase B [Tropicibacter naphthalenivorans]